MKISFCQLQAAPELALVVVIDRVLAIAEDAMYAAQPELHDEHLEHTSLRCLIAGHVVRDMSALRKLLARYHREVADELNREYDAHLDMPF